MAGEQAEPATAAPVTSAERIGDLDVLRGFALLGVLVANLVWFSFAIASIPAQREPFLSEAVNFYAAFAVQWLVSDKFNTLFAVLFGMGFWVQQERLRARGADFERIYLRRLTILLIFGFVNLFFLWPWDILQTYAIVGFILFAMRRVPPRTMLVLGVALMIIARPLIEAAFDAIGIADFANNMVMSDAAARHRQAIFVDGSYWEWVVVAFRYNWFDYFVSGTAVAWIVYALGRFLVGAWIIRSGWLRRAAATGSRLQPVTLSLLAAGLALEAIATAIEFKLLDLPEAVKEGVHALGSPVLALGYGLGIVLFYRSGRAPNWIAAFAPVGRMALTNYVLQGVFIGFLLFGFGPGLSLSGRLEPAGALALAIPFYALQIVVSAWWLQHFQFGPLEWAWRALTYRQRPTFSRPDPPRRLRGSCACVPPRS